MTSPRPPSSWSPLPPERRNSDYTPCPHPHPGTSLAMGAGPLQTLTHPNRATGTSALSAAIFPWQPGALVPTPLQAPRMGRWGGRSFCPPHSMHLPPINSTPPFLCAGACKASLLAPTFSKGLEGDTPDGAIPVCSLPPMSQFSPTGG